MRRSLLFIIALMAVICLPALAGEPAAPIAQPGDKIIDVGTPGLDSFQDAKFGIFVHWGVSSIPGKGEWVQANAKMPVAEYEQLLAKFNPEKFNATEWAELFKSAGARYVTLVTKHHDGFCLFDSKLTDYDVMATPLKRDIVKELTEACRAAGLQVFYYYSLSDWHHPDYWPWGWSGAEIPGRPRKGDNAKYIQYYQGQVRELCSNYGKIGGIWLDGEWDRAGELLDLPTTYQMIHQLQPAALVGNNHHHAPALGEDFQILEREKPVNKIREPFVPLETCDTINGSWGYNAADKAHKSPRDLLRTLVTAAGQGGNLLLNTGPLPDGSILPEHAKALQEMGQWLAEHGGSIYGTRRGPWVWQPWGVSTCKGTAAFLHVLNRPGDSLVLPAPSRKLVAAKAAGEDVKFELTDDPVRGREIAITLPPWNDAETVDFIVELTFDGPVDGQWIAEPIRPNAQGVLDLSAEAVELHGESFERFGGWLWKNENDSFAWHVQVPQAGQYTVVLTYACPEQTAGCELSIGTEKSRVTAKAEPTGSKWEDRKKITLPGTIELPAGNSTVTMKAAGKPKWAFMTWQQVQLRCATTGAANAAQ